MQDQAITLRRRLQQRIESGESKIAQKLLAEFPDVAEDSDMALELLYSEFTMLESLGRPETVESLCGDNEVWKTELARVIEVHEALRDTSLSIKPNETDTLTLDQVDDSLANGLPKYGPYEIVSRLGRGGMGTVYRARHGKLQRQVALKVLSVLAGPGERARLREESKLAARLSHANIVRIYDVGETDDGPFLAMELIEGETLAQRLARQEINQTDAAELTETLATAVQYAHEHNVVHRDLKPANVLIDATGKPLITDFGLAKTTLDETGGRELTVTGEIIGTPAYMSPELALGRSQQAGPATDIYSLGTILYEMLAGRPPFRGDSPLDTIAQIRDSESTPLRQLVPSLPRDLETITAKCLAKKPEERYATAQSLAGDLRRFIEGKPILAKPHSRLVHMSRWCRRRPTLTALIVACTLFPLLLAIGGWFSAWQQSKLRTEAESAREKAQHAAFETYDMTQFLLQNALISDNDDPVERWKEIDARVTEAMKRLDHPERKKQGISHILTAVTRLYVNYSAPVERLMELGERTLLVHESEKGPDSFETSSYRLLLGGIYRTAGDYENATTQIERAKSSFAKSPGVASSEYLEACRMLEGVDSLIGKKVTPSKLREADPKELNSIVYRLDEIERTKEEIEPTKIIGEVRELIDRLVELAPPTHHRIFRARVLLAGVLRRNGDYGEAERIYLDAIKSIADIYGPNHSDRLLMLNNLSWTYAEQGRLEEAVAIVKEVFETRKAHDGMDSPSTLKSLNNLGMSYKHLGDYEKALTCHELASKHSVRILGESSPQSIWLAICRADALTELGQVELAIRDLEATLNVALKSLGDDHLKTNQTRLKLADAYGENGKWEKAVEMAEKAVDSIRSNADGVTLKYLRATMTLGQIYQSAGRTKNCLTLLQKTERELASRYQEDHALRLLCQTVLGRAYFDAEAWDAAMTSFETVVRNEKRSAPNDVSAQMSQFMLGMSLLEIGQAEAAITQLNKFHAAMSELFAKYPPQRRERLARLVQGAMENFREADMPIERWELLCEKLTGE